MTISRRQFLGGVTLAGATAATAALAGCSPQAQNKPTSEASASNAAPSFEVAPEPIGEDKITKTIETDVVVIGAGDSGLMASLAASEAGAKVVMMDKNSKFMAHGLAHACINSKIHKEAGIKHDVNEILRYLTAQSNNRADMSLMRLWANESGAIYDHIIDMALEAGLMVIPMGGGDPNEKLFPEFNCALMFMGTDEIDSEGQDEGSVAQTWLFRVLEQAIKDNGADIHYNTTAQQLVKNDSGRIVGVIATDKDGNYVKYTAAKAVVLATGDYGNDPEMVAKYCPWQTMADVNFYVPPINTGDGHKMGLWAGAVMQPGPHCPALHPERVVGMAEPPMGASPVLRVNLLGERYENEQVPAPLVCEGRIRQPGNIAWAIFDGKWQQDAPNMSAGLLRTPAISELNVQTLEEAALKADTLSDLAGLMGVPADTFTKTVELYSSSAKAGVDEEFGKSANNLWTIEQPPFYAIEVPVGTMNTLGGLLINDSMQVLAKEDGSKVIPGLYAAGNVSGGFFGSTYPSAVSGVNKGWSIVGGYVAGRAAAANK